MKKYFLLILFAVFAISCSKKDLVFTGKINNPAPLSRIELIDVSSVATLPIANIGIDKKGNFSDTISVKKDGIYALVYQGKVNFLYLKNGENLNLEGNGSTFPEDLKISGKGQGNNEFLIESQKFITSYFSKLNQAVLAKNENDFIKEIEKYSADINKKLDEIAKSKNADKDVIEWKKSDLMVNLLMISSQYEMMHGQMTQNPDFKVSANFKESQKKFEKEALIKEFPAYRQYLLGKLEPDFRKFATPFLNDTKTTQTEVFLKFLETRKEFSQEQKDYLASYIATQFDLHPQNDKIDQVLKALTEKVKSENIKKDLERVYTAIIGPKVGSALPEVNFTKQDGKAYKISELKGKPTLLIFYSSFAPNIVQSAAALKEITEFYKAKLNVAYVNMDDDAKQFQKTSKSLFGGFTGVNLYAKGGLKSEAAQQLHIYGFKLPSFMILDKDGKVASKTVLGLSNIQLTELIDILNKQTGLSAPVPEASETEEEHDEHDGHGH